MQGRGGPSFGEDSGFSENDLSIPSRQAARWGGQAPLPRPGPRLTSHRLRRPVSCSRDQMLWILPACSGWLLLLPQAHWCFSISVSYTRPAGRGRQSWGAPIRPGSCRGRRVRRGGRRRMARAPLQGRFLRKTEVHRDPQLLFKETGAEERLSGEPAPVSAHAARQSRQLPGPGHPGQPAWRGPAEERAGRGGHPRAPVSQAVAVQHSCCSVVTSGNETLLQKSKSVCQGPTSPPGGSRGRAIEGLGFRGQVGLCACYAPAHPGQRPGPVGGAHRLREPVQSLVSS